jgi:hypothetical protein
MMDVIALPGGHFSVRLIEPDLLPRTVGEFATREEAEAWILRHALGEDEAAAGLGILKPGPSLDVT